MAARPAKIRTKTQIILLGMVLSAQFACLMSSKPELLREPALLSEIKSGLSSSDWNERLKSVRKLISTEGFSRFDESEKMILAVSYDTHSLIRVEAASGLSTLPGKAALQRLVYMALNDESDNVRWYSLCSLSGRNGEEVFDAFLQSADSEDTLIREAAFRGINRHPDIELKRKNLKTILRGITDGAAQVRIAAMTDIGFQSEEIYRSLKNNLKMKGQSSRHIAAALHALAGYSFDNDTREYIINILTGKNPELRLAALRVLKSEKRLD